MTQITSAIVLAGGRSRRLGEDKRTLRVASGRTQLEETIARVSVIADDVVVAGALDRPLSDIAGARVVADALPDSGPLGGLVSGLAAVCHDFSIAVACDLLLLSVDALRALAAKERDYDLLVPRRPDGRLEMLHAIYRKTCLPIATRRLAARQLKLADLVDDLTADGLVVRFVDDDEMFRIDGGLRTYFNVNTPDELRVARELLAAAGLGENAIPSESTDARGEIENSRRRT